MSLVRPDDDLRVGGEIDAYCTKCRLTTNHRIVAFDGDKIKKVICLTCQSQHVFRLAPAKKKENPDEPAAAKTARVPKEPKEPKPRTPRPPRESKLQAKKTPQDDIEASKRAWQERKETLGSGPLVPYTISGSFEAGQAIDHAHFGVGFILRVIQPNKIEVQFENTVKTLIMLEAQV
ncbi:MAG: hypothetical protein LBP22_15490 [Deltaproteobacteria bacterium]|jgi:hypothetical protein|nr:hypothetical protein [Deltaproteobacteria bacterium]